jgi:hypothetical protein
MKCAIVLAVMSALVAVPALAFEAQQGPAVKASTVKPPGSNSQPDRPRSPSAAGVPRLAAMPDSQPDRPRSPSAAGVPRLAARAERGSQATRTAPPTITLKEKRESVRRERHGAANVFEGGKITVTATGNTLSATLTDTANAYAYILCHSYAGALLHLEQEFEVTPSDPKYGWVVLTMSVKVDGHLRTDINGGASLKIASATVQPAGGGEALGLALSPRQMGGVQGSLRVLEEASSTPQVVPAGRFLLVADFVVEATADHICKGHGEVDFAPDSPEGAWAWPDPASEKIDTKDFGLTVTVKADTP